MTSLVRLFTRSSQQEAKLFEDNHYELTDLDAVPWKQRIQMKCDRNVTLYSNLATVEGEEFVFYEVVYAREQFVFLVYHNTVKDDTVTAYHRLRVVLNNLDKSITSSKAVAMNNLKSIVECLRSNSRLTSTMLAARLGFEVHFRECQSIVMEEKNIQCEPELLTPLHCAILHRHIWIVRALLDAKVNLDLLNYRNFSVLHYAAISSKEILFMILVQPGMISRMLWLTNQGATALHLACLNSMYNNVFEFLRFGLTVEMLTLAPPKLTSYPSSSKVGVLDPVPEKSRIISFTEQDLADIDCQDICFCGGPLHWAKHKRLMNKLLTHKFNLNTKNFNGDTALHIAAKRARLKCAITLLCAGAYVDASNVIGKTPLHHAVKQNDFSMVETLIVFEANIDATTLTGQSARHMAAIDSYTPHVLFLLSSLGAYRCPPGTKNCTPGCSFDGNFEGTSKQFDPTPTKLDRFFRNFQCEKLFPQTKRRSTSNESIKGSSEKQEPARLANMLTFDGGGIRGLVSIQILLEIEKYLDRPIVDYFKWIAGTSTGSFIATFLTIGMSLSKIRTIYFNFKDEVMIGNRPYPSEVFESALKELIDPTLKMKDLKTKFGKHVIIPAVLFDRNPMKLHLFRSYKSQYELAKIPELDQSGFEPQPSRTQLLWKACRASGAAPTYFRAFGPFIDGGLMANNPTLDALVEFEFYNNTLCHVNREGEVEKLNLVLSIGTGKQKVVKNEINDISSFYSLNPIEINHNLRFMLRMSNLLIQEICNADDHVVDRADAFCSAGRVPYFRVSPTIYEMIELDEQMDYKIIHCLWETKHFMYRMQDEVKILVNYINEFAQVMQIPPDPNKVAARRHTSKKVRRSRLRVKRKRSAIVKSKSKSKKISSKSPKRSKKSLTSMSNLSSKKKKNSKRSQ